jgi:uncharacterized protein (DUF1499 family)
MFEGWRGQVAQALMGVAVLLGVGTLVMTGGGTLLARLDLISKMDGFTAIASAGDVAAAGLVVSLLALSWRRFTRTQPVSQLGPTALRLAPWLVLLVCGADVAFLLSRLLVLQSVPVIHDVITNLQDPPAFALLAGQRAPMPDAARPAWLAAHQEAYSDLKTLALRQPVAQVLTVATTLAHERGWQIAASEPSSGRLEAIASVSLIRFHDDVVLRVRPADAGAVGSLVDMRSRSRIGASDLGVNAKRIREFLQALAAASDAL